MSDPQRPHGLQPTRLLCPWDLPGKSRVAIAFSALIGYLTYLSSVDSMVNYPMPKVFSGHTILISAFILLPITVPIHTLHMAFMNAAT